MPPTFETLLETWTGESVLIHRDRPTGTWVFIALYSTRPGTPMGGTRMRVYDRPADGLRDALRLAEGMAYKWACLGLEKGGGKAVLAVPEPMRGKARRDLLLRYGKLVESLGGAFATGEDLGTTPADMAVLHEVTRYVHGIREDGRVTDPGPFTANGVAHGIRSVVTEVLDRRDLEGLRVAVQGLGDVGEPLVRILHRKGADLTLADVEVDRAEELARELGAASVPAAEIYCADCDVFAPCAVGGILNPSTIPQLRCRIVAGSANNQLEVPDRDSLHLRDRGIVYVPDFVINAGGALVFGTMTGTDGPEELMAKTEAIGFTVREILREAREREETPLEAAFRRAERVLRD